MHICSDREETERNTKLPLPKSWNFWKFENPIKPNDWEMDKAQFVVVTEILKHIIGRSLCESLSIRNTQQTLH